MKVLVVAAHPDDEVLGCGATIAKMAQQGHEVFVGILGEGLNARIQPQKEIDPKALTMLKACAREAAGILGAKDVFFSDLPDNRFDTVSLLDITKIVETWITRIKPGVIYTHSSADLNKDHQLTHRAVVTATRPQMGMPVHELYAFEVPSATEWAFSQWQPTFIPQHFQDVSSTLESKVKAMMAYKTETRDFPHPRSAEALRALAQHRGSMVGLSAAEAFMVIRVIHHG